MESSLPLLIYRVPGIGATQEMVYRWPHTGTDSVASRHSAKPHQSSASPPNHLTPNRLISVG